MSKERIRNYALLGAGPYDKLVLGLFAVASSKRLKRIYPFLPKMWLRPRKLKGLKLLIDPTDQSQTVIFDEVFLQSNYELERVLFEPDLIIDCGGHIGLFSLLAQSAFPNVPLITYEPNPQNIWYIHRQISGNNLNIELNEMAVSTECGVSEFAAISSHGGKLKIDKSEDALSDSPTYKVNTIDLSGAIAKTQPGSLLLKMDIEGEERKVLPAIMHVLPKKTALFFETHFGETGWQEIEMLLNSHGFFVEKLNARGLYCDGFASRN